MIEIKELTKNYGSKSVINNLNLTLESGWIYSLLGKNGAGKTTTIHLILDLLKADSGSILINGKENTKLTSDDKTHIGVLGEDLALIEELSGSEFLSFIGKIYKMSPAVLTKRIDDLSNYFFEDKDDLKKNTGKYSTGMKKKIAFCAAVLHTPDILILDEPFSGLDPFAANQMVSFLQRYAREGRLLFISSHDLNYVEKISTHIGVLDGGGLVFNSTIKDFTENGADNLDSALLKLLKPNNAELDKMDWI